MAIIPTDNTQNLVNFLNDFETPQIIGGNHSTDGCNRLVKAHLVFVDGQEVFQRPPGSKLTLETLEYFRSRFAYIVLSPLPLDFARRSARMKSALLTFSRELNDQAKNTKTALLSDNLIKTRKCLEDFLRTSVDSKTKQPYFASDEEVWPQCHSDLQKKIYSISGIQTVVGNALSKEFASQRSNFKVAVTCPDAIFQLMLELASIPVPPPKSDTKGKAVHQKETIINSCKNLRNYTLVYCTREDLKKDLQVAIETLKRGKKEGCLSKLDAEHSQRVTFTYMLNVIATDLEAEKAQDFLQRIGPKHPDGFYTEASFEQVSL